MTATFSPSRIHPTAVVHPQAELHPTVQVGPHAVIGAHVVIGAETFIAANVVIEGHTTLGEYNRIFPGATIGLEPQDLKYTGAASKTLIGDHNQIRECVTVNRATNEGEATRIGSHNLLMAYSHVAHNCQLADHIVIANSVALAGHVCVESRATLGGLVGVHQFTRIGRLAMVGGMARIDRDVPPFMLAEGTPGRLRGLNTVGLKRAGYDGETLQLLRAIYRQLYRSGQALEVAIASLASHEHPLVQELVGFLQASVGGKRGPLPARRGE